MSIGWWDILKSDIRNEAQYNAASLDERRRWHIRQSTAYHRRLKALQTQHSVDLTDVENPVYQEMKEYQNLRNFHHRQNLRIRRCLASGKTECNDYYSQELEGDNRQNQKLKTTPTGKSDPHVELSLEAYNNPTDKQKINYHQAMRRQGIDKIFHGRMYNRLLRENNQPVFPSPKYGGESTMGLENTKEEYDNMDDKNKREYHGRMASRAKRNNKELYRFHEKMYNRLRRNSSLPVYYSPEHEQEES